MPDKYRVQLDFATQDFRLLEQLQESASAPTRAETIRYALRILKWVIDVTNDGGRILVRWSDGTTEAVVFPFLPVRSTVKRRDVAQDAVKAALDDDVQRLRARGADIVLTDIETETPKTKSAKR